MDALSGLRHDQIRSSETKKLEINFLGETKPLRVTAILISKFVRRPATSSMNVRTRVRFAKSASRRHFLSLGKEHVPRAFPQHSLSPCVLFSFSCFTFARRANGGGFRCTLMQTKPCSLLFLLSFPFPVFLAAYSKRARASRAPRKRMSEENTSVIPRAPFILSPSLL